MIELLWKSQRELLLRQRELEAQIEQLHEQLHSDSTDSSKPPSSDTPGQRAKRPRKRHCSGKSQGAQPGHKKHERVLVAESALNHVERFYPESQCRCGGAVVLDAEPAVRHQVFDLPEVRYQVTEYQLYGGDCARCGQRTTAQLPDWVPSGQMGAGLISWIGLLAGEFHLSIRAIQRFLKEQWPLTFSIGAISQAQGKMNLWLGPVYRQIGDHVRRADVAHADETTHYREGEQRWLWCLTTPLAVYLLTHFSRGKAAAMELLGYFSGILVTDHYAGYNGYPAHLRQLFRVDEDVTALIPHRPGRAQFTHPVPHSYWFAGSGEVK